MSGSVHLLLPLFSSLLFVVGALFAKRAGNLGISPYTTTAFANTLLGSTWFIIGLTLDAPIERSAVVPAIWIAFTFVLGQVCTYLAFQWGDVSLATPVFGIKIIIVAWLSAVMTQHAIAMPIWIAAVLAALGIAVIQKGPSSGTHVSMAKHRVFISISLAMLAASSLSLFDVGVQHYGRLFGAERFLSLMFVIAGLLSMGLLPLGSGLKKIRETGATKFLLLSALLMAGQAMSITYALGKFGDATRVNIVYSLRGLWSVGLVWILSRWLHSEEMRLPRTTMIYRLIGASLLTISVCIALVAK